MDKLDQIEQLIEEHERKYEDKLLLGLIEITENQMNLLERKVKEILFKYSRVKHMSEIESFWISAYVIFFDMYTYDGERFWESLSRHLRIDEKEVRPIVIEAMKNNYSSREWMFYLTTRNEYVETIRMHGIIGNDNSGDKIIYALYYIYLKDFEKELSKEKFNLFFPYLKSLFERYGNFEEEIFHGKIDTIAYIRGQLPKSFIHAFLLNTPAVSELVKQIFKYFHSRQYNLELPKSLNTRLSQKIEQSFLENNNFENEHTIPYISKESSKPVEKDVIQYYNHSVQLHIPNHFLDFKPNENRSAELKIYEEDKLLMKNSLVVFDGAIGWKNERFTTYIKGRHSKIRYTICKKQNNEILYDSEEKYYKLPSLYIIQQNGEREQADPTKLESGYVYEMENAPSNSIINAPLVQSKKSAFFLMENHSEILIGSTRYEAVNKEALIYKNKKQKMANMQIIDENKHLDIYQNVFSLGILAKFPYSLNELEIIVNEKRFSGLELRKELLTKIKVKDNRDFLYIFELKDYLKVNAINNIKVNVVLKDIKLLITEFRMFYVKEPLIQYELYNFHGKKYIHFNDFEPNVVKKKDDIIILNHFNNTQQQLIINIKSETEELPNLPIPVFKRITLFAVNSGKKIFEEEKETIIRELFDEWYLDLEEYLNDLVVTTEVDLFFYEIVNHFDEFLKMTEKSLPRIDKAYLYGFLKGLQQIVTNKLEENILLEDYILPFIEIINLKGANQIFQENIHKTLRKYRPDYSDESQSIRYKVANSTEKEKIDLLSIIKGLSINMQKLAQDLYQIASRSDLNERKTIYLIKEIYETNSYMSEMGYYELILSFRDLLNGKELSFSAIDEVIFINMFYFFADDYNVYSVCDYMNLLEEWIDRNKTDDKSKYIRSKILELAQALSLDVLLAKEYEQNKQA